MTQSTPTAHYDLIIIGTGSGNSIPGPDFDDKKIAIIEKGRFGGTCLNVGCIPTKMYVLAADAATTVEEATKLGVNAHVDSIDFESMKKRIFADRIDLIAAGGEEYRRGEQTPNIDVYDKPAHFIGEKTIATGQGDKDVVITGDTIVIAAGARPAILPVIAKSGVAYETSDTVMRMDTLPSSMIVMGGGFIATEFAHVFASFGVDVTIINRSPKLLKHLDAEVSERYTTLAQQRFTTYLGRTVAQAETTADGQVALTLDDATVVTAEKLLVATGRTRNGDLLNLSAAGVAMDGDRIVVNEYGQTTAPGVWALGDVSSPYQLKHVANSEGRTVAHNLLHPNDLQPMNHTAVPSAIFTHPQIATVGLTEQQARDQGFDVTVKVQNYGDVAYGWALEDTTGFAKLVADRSTGVLLGAHIIGDQAATLVQMLIPLVADHVDVRGYARSYYWIHPALGELIENALLGLEFDPS